MVAKCPAANTASIEQDRFWDGNWDAHKIGWLISGAAAAVTCLITLITITGHARNYNRPLEQRQIIRVLLFPPVYAVISFFSYRFFRSYTYYELVESVWEAIAIASFLLLLLQYIGNNAREQVFAFVKKDKRPLPLPFCCFRFRPSKAYFLVTLKWSVVQYCLLRPAISVAGIVTEYYEVYCSSSLSYKYAYVYLTAVDFVSITIALYGLFVLYVLVKDDLKGKRPLAKFSTIKIGIFLIFYQGFIFDLLGDHGALHATAYWTTTNISDGLNALCTSLEMVLIAAMQMWAFYWGEYTLDNLDKPSTGKANTKGKTNPLRSILHALNLSDLLIEAWNEVVFLFDRMRGKEYTRHDARMDFAQAFGANDEDSDYTVKPGRSAATATALGGGNGLEMAEDGRGNSHHGSVPSDDRLYGTERSDQGLLAADSANRYPPSHGAHPTNAYATARPAYRQPSFQETAPYPASTRGTPYDGGAAGAASTGPSAHERPLSWEPQAM